MVNGKRRITADAAPTVGLKKTLDYSLNNTNNFLNVVPLLPNAVYVVDNGYIEYETDELGRVEKITATLNATTRGRDELQQQQAKHFKNGDLGSPPDDGGHMIGSRFRGIVEQINYFPQDLTSNRYTDWKNMENEWYATLPKPNANPPVAGQSVKVEIKPVFDPPTSKRPKEFHITYWYGGSTTPASIQSNGDTFKTVENP